MRITVECDYAFRIILHLAANGMEKKLDAASIAQSQKIPQRFSVKILRKLTMANLIKSYKGVKGGYMLSRNPSEISMYDVVNVIDGDIEVNRCLNEECDCMRIEKSKCPVHKELAILNEYISNKLKSISFEDLLKE